MMRPGALRVLRAVVLFLYRLVVPVAALGIEYVPESGGVILCANHESLTDPIALICSLKRWVRFMGKKELFLFKPLGALLRALGMFPVDRGGSDLGAIRKALSILEGGEVLGIFPQGTRVFKGGDDFHTGVALIALRSGAPVVPVYISGRTRIFRKTHLTFGQSVDLSAFGGRMDSQTLAAATTQIRSAVYALGRL